AVRGRAACPILPGTVLLSQSAIPWTQRTSPVSDAVTGAPGGSTRGRRGSTGATAPSHYTGRQTASVRHRRSQASPRRRPSEL
ncbi:hypothetical protein PIB30_113795, partial [Stylosanthes scabra]|nr:hypothetical protein [Stylosanthes scabra]